MEIPKRWVYLFSTTTKNSEAKGSKVALRHGDMETWGQRRLPPVLTMVRAALQGSVATPSSKLTGVFDLLLASS